MEGEDREDRETEGAKMETTRRTRLPEPLCAIRHFPFALASFSPILLLYPCSLSLGRFDLPYTLRSTFCTLYSVLCTLYSAQGQRAQMTLHGIFSH